MNKVVRIQNASIYHTKTSELIRRRNCRISLHDACELGKVNLVKLLLEKGANANIRDSNGFTTMYFASKVGNVEIMRLLSHCNFNFKLLINSFGALENNSNNYISVYLNLCYYHYLDCLTFLFGMNKYNKESFQINILMTDKFGRNALHLAIIGLVHNKNNNNNNNNISKRESLRNGLETIEYLLDTIYFPLNTPNIEI